MFTKVAVFAVLAIAVATASYVPVKQVVPVVVKQYAPQPYAFGYNIKDKYSQQFRQEKSDGYAVQGSYGFIDNNGIQRQVVYVADDVAGFRANIRTNEPGTANQNPAAVNIVSTVPKAYVQPVANVVVPVKQVVVQKQVVPAYGNYGNYGVYGNNGNYGK